MSSREYYTPYYTTVVFDADDWFQTGIANMCDYAQLVPISRSITDMSVVADSIKYLSPEVVIFDSLGVTSTITDSFFKRGYGKIKIVANEATASASSLSTSTEDSDPNIVVFGLNDIDNYIKFRGGLMAYRFYDIMRIHRFNITDEIPTDITRDTARHFINGVFLSLADEGRETPMAFGEAIGRMVDTLNSFQLESEYIMKGKFIEEDRKRLVAKRLSAATQVTFEGSTVAIPLVYASDLYAETILVAHSKYHGVAVVEMSNSSTHKLFISYKDPTPEQQKIMKTTSISDEELRALTRPVTQQINATE